MAVLFSPSTCGFYLADLHGDRIPGDAVEISDGDHAALMAAQAAGQVIAVGIGGKPIAIEAPAPLVGEVAQACSAALRAHIDAGARAWGYDSAATAASYAVSTNPRFKAEARALIAWRDQAWHWAEGVLEAVKAGKREPHETPSAFVADSPPIPTRPAH